MGFCTDSVVKTMSFNEYIPQVYVLRYDKWNSLPFIICKLESRNQYCPYVNSDFKTAGTRYRADLLHARLITAAHLGDVVLPEDLLFPNVNSPKDPKKPNLQALIDKAYHVMSPEARAARQKRVEDKQKAPAK